MASIPNTGIAPGPVPAGKLPAPAAKSTDFAQQLAEIPEELVRLAAAILCGGGDDAATPPDGAAGDATAEDGGDADGTETADQPTDAATLAALAPILQPLPAVVAVPAVAPAPAATQAPAAEAAPKTAAVATKAPTPAPTATLPAPAPASAPAPAPGAPARSPQVKAGADPEAETEAEPDQAGADAGGREKAPALDSAAKEAIAAARRAIDATMRLTRSAIAEAAPKLAHPMARLAASALETVKGAGIAIPGADASTPGAGIAAATAPAAQIAPAPAPTVQPREAAAPTPNRSLDLANDAEWLDRLARDIAQASGNEGAIRFRLHPQTLGHLRVELSQGDHGTTIRLTADTEHARAILADAQPRLAAEARAQGVRIAETHVDLSGSDRRASDDPRRQDDRIPMIRTARDAAAGEDKPERPGRSRSDRYA